MLEQTVIWDRFESGESLRSISRRLGRPPSTIRTHVVSAGWKRPVSTGSGRRGACRLKDIADSFRDSRPLRQRVAEASKPTVSPISMSGQRPKDHSPTGADMGGVGSVHLLVGQSGHAGYEVVSKLDLALAFIGLCLCVEGDLEREPHRADIRRLDRDIKAAKALVREEVTAADTTLTDIYGVGPMVAAFVVGYTGDPSRFATADHYAAYIGTAPIVYSSSGSIKHRLSLRGNRSLTMPSTWLP